MTADNPTMGEVLVNDKDSWRDLPDTGNPYFILAREGMFAHRRTAQGRGFVKASKMPTKIKELGFPHGYFHFDGKIIPATIYAQAVHFFRRIFEKHHTEAEVIITQHRETGDYRLFVPHQRVSHGGVYSIYNPANIDRNYLVIGTFHSHCDFGAGHSSTDEGDARDMDGLHGTIGYITRPEPELALMYALNGQFFHFGAPFTGVVDTTDLNAATAPEWWDRYVIIGTVKDADRQKIAPYADDATWDAFMGRKKKLVVISRGTTQPANQPTTWLTGGEDDFDDSTLETYYRSIGYTWNADKGELEPLRPYQSKHMLSESRLFNRGQVNRGKDEDINIGTDYDDYWEHALGAEYVDGLFNSDLFTEEDLEAAIRDWPDSGTHEYWERVFRTKLLRSVLWLRAQGFNCTVNLTDPRVKVLPGQTTLEDYANGAVQ